MRLSRKSPRPRVVSHRHPTLLADNDGPLTKENNPDVVRDTYGNSADYLTARIKRDHPDILKRMQWLRQQVKDLLTDEKPALGNNQHTPGFGNTKPTQDDATYALRRLKRDAPCRKNLRSCARGTRGYFVASPTTIRSGNA